MDPRSGEATTLERSASVLARQLAMAKLTGQPPPAVPQGLLEPLPTLEQLQQKASGSSRPRLGRNNTVTSATPPAFGDDRPRPRLGRSNTVSEAPPDRQAIGANLIRKLSARRGGGGGGGGGGDPSPSSAPPTAAAAAAAAAAAELPPLPPALPLPSLPFSLAHPSTSDLPPPTTTTTTTTQPQEDDDADDQRDREEPVVSSSSLRSGSATSATSTDISTSTSSSSPPSYTFPPPSNYHNDARIDPRRVRPLATFGIAAVEGVPAPSRVTAVTSEGGGGGEEDPRGYRYRERGSSASSSLVLHQQQRAYADDAQLRRTGSISVSSMLSSPGGTSEEEDGEEGELSTRGGDMSGGGGGGGGFSSSGNQDPTASSRTRTRTRTDRMGSIGLGLEAGAAAGSAGIIAGPGFFDHHQFRLSSRSEAPRDAAAAASDPVGEEGGTEEGTTPTLAQTSQLEGGGGGGGAAAAESTPRLPAPSVVVGSEDAVSEGAGGVGGGVGGGVETTPRLGHHHHHHHRHDEEGSSSARTRTPTMVGTETETPGTATSTATEAPTRGRVTPPPPPSASTHSHTSAPSTTSVTGQQHPPPPLPPQRSLALTLSDYHPFGASPHPAGGPLASNISGHYHHPGVSRGGSQTTTPLVLDPISPTSVIPNPMEAIEFPLPACSSASASTEGGNDTPRIEQQKAANTNQRDQLLQVPSLHAGPRETAPSSPSPARSETARSLRSGVATATVTEEEEEDEEADDTRDPGATATSSDYHHPSPNLASSSAEIARPALMHTSSTESTASMGAGGGGGGGSTMTMASLPPFEPRVTRLPAAELPANRILAQLDSILGPEPDQPSSQQGSSPSPATGLLDPPPRKLLLSSPVLQVVNANAVKDRYLLLFSDMLVIAKPLIEDHALTGEPVLPDLDGHFLVKSVVECKHLKLSADEDPVEESSSSATAAAGGKKKHPLLVAFVDRFANDPARAIASLISKGGLANDGPTIANLLYRNTDLNRNQLGAYLSDRHQRHVLRAYIDRFRFAGVRIDDALRLFLMSVRLPFDGGAAADYVIGVLANMWAEANTATGIDGAVAQGLMTAIMHLSDALHGGDEPGERFFRGSKPSVPPTVDDFIASFRDVDTRSVVPEDLLARIYTAVRRERVENASDNSLFSMTPDIEATIEPAKLPTQLVYRTPSTRFTITIPGPDPKFTIKLQGADLQFDPPVLSFARNAKQSFRVTGTALGVRTMVLIKRGANAPRYQGLPLNKAFSIERGFMQHTFQLSFTNHLDLKRKYMFSCRDAETRSRWLRLLRERIAVSAGTPIPATPAQAAANAVAVQVLRDAVLAPDEPGVLSAGTPSPRPNVVAPRFGRPVTPSTPRGRLGTPTRPPTAARSNSISRLYPVLYRQEAESGEKRTTAATTTTSPGILTPAASGGGGGGSKSSTANNPPDPSTSELSAARLLHGDFVKSGHELVVTTEQNSLLPLVLTFLNAGLEAAPHPLSLRGSAFQLPPLDGTPAPLPSFVSQP